MEFVDEALVLTLRPHGEHGAVVRFLSFSGGLRAGYVHGARSARRRAMLSPGNRVAIRLRARAEGQLAQAHVELVESRALAAFDPAGAAILGWATTLTSAALAEEVPHTRLAEALDALAQLLAAGAGSDMMRAALARYELLLLDEEGFGLDIAHCALGGSGPPAFVSPRTGRAVSAEKAEGQPWQARLLPLPPFLAGKGSAPGSADIEQALRLTGHFLAHHWLDGVEMEQLRQRAVGSTGAGD